jgi:hypothetical protein
MKKLLLAVLVLFLVTGALFAQTAGSISVGIKAGGVLGFHDSHDLDMDSKFNFAIGAYGAYAFSDSLSVQAELDFMIGQGLTGDVSGVDVDATYNSLDIPILVKYSFLNKPLVVGVEVGPQLSIPIGDIEMSGGGTSVDIEPDGMTFGAVAGIYAGYPIGPGRIIGDLRFLFDFNALQGKMAGATDDFITRRALIFAVGYEFSF